MNDIFSSGIAGDSISDIKEVKIRLSSKHIMHDMERFARYGSMLTMFEGGEESAQVSDMTVADPEDYPEEMTDALQEILENEQRKLGVSDSGDVPGEISVGDEFSDISDINKKLDMLVEMLTGEDTDGADEDDVCVFETCGTMQKRISADGREIIEIEYTEDESMDDTVSVISYDPSLPNQVTIYRTGGVISALVCEEGVRHITVYNTPVSQFELALYTKKCRGGFNMETGGLLSLDYILELRGADLQRTKMDILVTPMPQSDTAVKY